MDDHYSVNWDKIREMLESVKDTPPPSVEEVYHIGVQFISAFIVLGKADSLDYETCLNELLRGSREVFEKMWDAPTIEEYIEKLNEK